MTNSQNQGGGNSDRGTGSESDEGRQKNSNSLTAMERNRKEDMNEGKPHNDSDRTSGTDQKGDQR